MGVTEVTHPPALSLSSPPDLSLESTGMCFSRVVARTPRESQILATQKNIHGLRILHPANL